MVRDMGARVPVDLRSPVLLSPTWSPPTYREAARGGVPFPLWSPWKCGVLGRRKRLQKWPLRWVVGRTGSGDGPWSWEMAVLGCGSRMG